MQFAVIHDEARLVSDSGLNERATQLRGGAGLITMHGLLQRHEMDAPDTQRLLHIKCRA